MGWSARQARSAWLLLTPTLIALLLVAGWPLARTLWFSLTDASLTDLGAAQLIGWENYLVREEGEWYGVLADPLWWRAVRNTLVFTVVSVSLETVLARAKGRKDAEGARIYRIALRGEPIVVGRSSKADLILPEGTVSNRHAELNHNQTGGYTIKDLGSANGTYIDGRRIPPQRVLEFRPDQSLWFASYRTIFITAAKAYEMVARYGQVAGA